MLAELLVVHAQAYGAVQTDSSSFALLRDHSNLSDLGQLVLLGHQMVYARLDLVHSCTPRFTYATSAADGCAAAGLRAAASWLRRLPAAPCWWGSWQACCACPASGGSRSACLGVARASQGALDSPCRAARASSRAFRVLLR